MRRLTNSADSASRELLQYLSNAWGSGILEQLAARPCRFSDIKERLGIPRNTLARILRKLERDGVVGKVERLGGPVEYELTHFGRSFWQVAVVCDDWVHQHAAHVTQARRAFGKRVVHSSTTAWVDEPSTFQAPQHAIVLSHVATVVKDIDEAARSLAAIFAIETPKIIDSQVIVPRVGSFPARVAWVKLGNFWINLIEATDEHGPYRQFVAQRRRGLHLIGFDVPSGIDSLFNSLIKSGGAGIARGHGGKQNVEYAELDLRSSLGTAIQIIQGGNAAREVPTTEPTLVGARVSVSSIGVVVEDIDRARRLYASLLGMNMTHPHTAHFVCRSRGGTQRARVQVGTIRYSRIAINVIQPIDHGPLKRTLDRAGGTVHIGLQVNAPFDQVIAELHARGGRIVGDIDSGYVHVDLMDSAGIVFALTSKSRVRKRPSLFPLMAAAIEPVVDVLSKGL